MKRLFGALLVGAMALMAPALGSATWTPEEQERCAADDNAGPVYVEAESDSDDSGHLTLCNDDADFPLEGNITLQGDASQNCATGSIDGDPENPDVDLGQDGQGDLDGYAALEIDGDEESPVGVENYGDGDYQSDCPSD